MTALSNKIINAKSNDDAYGFLKELTGLYFEQHRYNECADYLKSLIKRKKTLEPLLDYYIGFTRYQQLRYLEESQSWDEYFNKGNNYRKEITESLEKTINAVSFPEALGVYARLILWRFHKDQNDVSSEKALSDLRSITYLVRKKYILKTTKQRLRAWLKMVNTI